MNTCGDQLDHRGIMESIRASLEDIEEDFRYSRSPDPSIAFPAQTRLSTKISMLRLMIESFIDNMTASE